MKQIFLTVCPIYLLLLQSFSTEATTTCKVLSSKRTGIVVYQCTELTSLARLEKARNNTTDILISESKIPLVKGHAFARFGPTLRLLDLHNSAIEIIEARAFVGLVKLEKLKLWGNKLKWVPGDWFANMYSLRTLDLSFNFIRGIDYPVFHLLPYLENFYLDYNQLKFIDYNMFAYLRSLKKVKFGKNPLSWPYRARLTWQLENQHVEYTDEWEDWGWMNVVIKDCVESGQGEVPSDMVLDCVTGKLLDFTFETLAEETRRPSVSAAGCYQQARSLIACMRPKNATVNTDNRTVRRILEDYVTVFKPMSRSQATFSTKST